MVVAVVVVVVIVVFVVVFVVVACDPRHFHILLMKGVDPPSGEFQPIY